MGSQLSLGVVEKDGFAGRKELRGVGCGELGGGRVALG